MKSYNLFFLFMGACLLFTSNLYSMKKITPTSIRDIDTILMCRSRERASRSPLCNEHTPLLDSSSKESDEEVRSYEERFLIDFAKYVVSKGRAKDINALNKYLAIEGNEEFLFSLCFFLKGFRNKLPVLRHPIKVYSYKQQSVHLSIKNTHIIRGRYKTNCDVVKLNYACSVDSPKSHSRIVLLFLSAILRKIPNKIHRDREVVANGCYVKVFIR